MALHQTSSETKDLKFDYTPNGAASIDINKLHIPRNSSNIQGRNSSIARHDISASRLVAHHQDHPYTSDMSCSPNSSSPSSLSAAAGPQFNSSPICAADALAAVDLLPLPKVPITSSRYSGIISASNNMTTFSHNELINSRSVGDQVWNIAKDSNSERRPNHSYNGASNAKPKSSPIIIIERLNPLNREIFGASQTTGNKDMSQNTNYLPNASQSTVTGSSSNTSTSGGHIRMKSRPKTRVIHSSPSSPTQQDDNNHHSGVAASGGKRQKSGIWHQGRFDVRGHNSATPFSWDSYLSHIKAKIAPTEAFRQPKQYPKNTFEMHMMLEARDPRNFSNWCLASVVHVEGLQIGLRLEGTDKMNDLFELIDSENIRPIGSCPGEPLLAPTNYSKDIKTYPKFVEKILEKATYATPECFPPPPPKPPRNLFEPGMKLEAVDRKHRDLVCPATVTEMKGGQLRVSFDGWSDSFDYWCEYHSRDLFPVNYCRDVGRTIQAPGGWPDILKTQQPPPTSSHNGSSTSLDKSFSVSESSISTRRLTSALVESTTKAHKPSAPGTFSSKKTRGRPKRDAHTDLAYQVARPVNTSSETNDINPKNINYEDCNLKEAPTKTSDMIDDLELKAELLIEGFQCQRASVYPWQLMRLEKEKKKQDTDQMPQYSSPVVTEQDISANGFSTPTSSANTATQDQEVKKPKLEQPTTWTIDDVIDLITKYETFTQYSELFRENEIDGKAFLLLTYEVLIKHMGIKVGHAVKMIDLVNQVKKQYNLD